MVTLFISSVGSFVLLVCVVFLGKVLRNSLTKVGIFSSSVDCVFSMWCVSSSSSVRFSCAGLLKGFSVLGTVSGSSVKLFSSSRLLNAKLIMLGDWWFMLSSAFSRPVVSMTVALVRGGRVLAWLFPRGWGWVALGRW